MIGGSRKIKRRAIPSVHKVVCSECGAIDTRENEWDTAKPRHRELARQLAETFSLEDIAKIIDNCRDWSVKINQYDLDAFGLSMDDFANVLCLAYLLKKVENGCHISGRSSWDTGNVLCPKCVDADVFGVEFWEGGFLLKVRVPERIRHLQNSSIYLTVLPWIAWKKDEV